MFAVGSVLTDMNIKVSQILTLVGRNWGNLRILHLVLDVSDFPFLLYFNSVS